MSLWKIGANDVSEEAQAMKDHLSSKDSYIASQESKVMKQAEYINELQATLNEITQQLRREADRAVKLESDLTRATEELAREKIASQNVEASLASTQDKIKLKERETQELESIVQDVSRKCNDTTTQRYQLEKEKATLEARVRELEVNCRQLSQPPPPAVTPSSRLPRRRSSSVSGARIPVLEDELQRVKQALAQKERELEDGSQKLSRAQNDLVKCENEKMASDRRTRGELQGLRETLEEKNDEINYLRGQAGDGSREAELMARIDEDELKITELEKLVGDVPMLKDRLRRAEAKAQAEARENEARNIELVAEKEAALDELEEAQAKIQTLSQHIARQEARVSELIAAGGNHQTTASAVDGDTAAHVERLLAAIERLRGERDGLRRDLEYVQVESRCEIEALEARISKQLPITSLPIDTTSNSRSDVTSPALAIVVGRLHERLDISLATCQDLRTQLREKDELVQQLETQAASAMDVSEGWTGQFGPPNQLLEDAQNQLSDTLKALEEAESQRDSLALQVTNLTADLAAAQDELEEAENRRTEQVGLHQHDIKRLETNLKLQEERLMEMTMEMETLAAQKEAMVEDCATAREARDEAQQHIETLEVEAEQLEADAEVANQSTVNLVAILVDTISRSREAVRSRAQDCQQLSQQLALKDSQMRHFMSLHERCDTDMQTKTTDLQALNRALVGSQHDARKMVVALAVMRVEGLRAASLLNQLRSVRSNLHQRIVDLEGEYAALSSEKHALSLELDALRTELETSADLQLNERSTLETRVRELEAIIAEANIAHQSAIDKLTNQSTDLQQRLINAELVNAASNNSELTSLNSRLEEVQARLETAESASRDAEMKLRSSETSLADSNANNVVLQQQLQDANVRYDQENARCVALEEQVAQQSAKLTELHGSLEASELRSSQDRTQMQTLEARTEAQIAEIRKEMEGLLDDERTLSATLQGELDDCIKRFEETAEKNKELEAQLITETEARCSSVKALEAAVAELTAGKLEIENNLDSTRGQLEDLKVELASANTSIQELKAERESLFTEITSLEAEVQKTLSMHRYLENQAKQSGQEIISLNATIDTLHHDLSEAQKHAQSSEMNLSLQSSQHKREMSELQRQITAFQSRPALDGVVQELEERVAELDALLGAKCVEIEENDDRVLDMLKENKKLNSKVESLTRKVQALQAKLATTKPASPVVSQPIASSSRHDPLASSVQRTRSVTAPSKPLASAAVPPVPQLRLSASTRVPPSLHVEPEPSALRRPKTPVQQPASVFKARTPEKPVFTEEKPSSAGKKRRAPDDFDLCENVPPQVFTADSVPGDDSQDRTPRVRRVLQTLHSGFTPVRHQIGSRSNPSLASPKRSTTMGSRSPSKSPRLSSTTKSKRSWLGKIRGASQPPRPDVYGPP
ncbi:hypothetical protein ONZ45_g15750 [Pleurotus djamor]|nr:hypothetical protein ONZ45_g15750 [Pleurotus djamor]